MEFRNLKKNIKRHIHTNTTHKKKKLDEEQEETKHSSFRNKNFKTGMCMKLFLRGRLYTDYDDDFILHYMNGAAVGEQNHSRKFPAAFRPFLCTVITQRVKKSVCTLLLQTGHLPAVNITADKATYKHDTRQFLSCVTVVPGTEDLLQVKGLGQAMVKGHKGIDMAKNIKEWLDIFNLQSCQIEGGSSMVSIST